MIIFTYKKSAKMLEHPKYLSRVCLQVCNVNIRVYLKGLYNNFEYMDDRQGGEGTLNCLLHKSPKFYYDDCLAKKLWGLLMNFDKLVY